MMKIKFFFLSVLFFPQFLLAQSCNLTLTGIVLDKGTNIPLEYSTIFLKNLGQGTVSDKHGFFEIKNICAGEYHIQASHVGCHSEEYFIKLEQDTLFKIYLSHHSELLDEVVIHGSHEDNSTESSQTISRGAITEEGNKNLSDILGNISGVSVLRNGSGISKPVVHGLFGNRVAILNNGIAQSGQQWGSDHAPEIDPFVADHLSVVKGASALAYGGNSLGSVVLVETDNIQEDPHLHGEVNYTLQSNGWGHTLNSTIEKNGSWAAWRITGTLKRQGDNRTSNYFLTNTGKKENNLALQIEKQFHPKWKTDFYYSLFNTKIGILRGSHIGNLTDLETAIGRSEPFAIEDNFSYSIAAPKQQVTHHLVKMETKYLMDDEKIIKFKYGGQLNNREEFDIRRGEARTRPSLSLSLFSHHAEAAYNGLVGEKIFLKAGIQFDMVDNGNNPGTGVSPLIPNYRSYQTSTYWIVQNDQADKWLFEFGGRFSLKQLTVKRFTQSPPRELEIIGHLFQNYALSTGLRWEKNDFFKTNFNIGYLLRAPEVNELYSFGLHQGVSGIEEGNRNMDVEKSLKALLSVDFRIQNKFFVQALGYFQNVQDYIFLEPQKEFRLTIRGAFPVFLYKQTNANITGLDLLLKYEPKQNLNFILKYALVRGNDLTNDIGLINIPSDNILSSMTYTFKDGGKWKNNFLTINGRYVFQQTRIEESQDFLSPPDDYFLIGLQVGTNFEWQESSLKVSLRAENLMNTTYRDYLNRLRYFADENGINVSLNLNYRF
ncbi:MAG: TonB-dependent receptor [Saprospiraceae bacterium]|nr:TonB-dependent receptor [Saprospiraceae bacterium]